MKNLFGLLAFLLLASQAISQKHLASTMLNPDYKGDKLSSMATVCLMTTKKQSEQVEGLITRASSKHRFKTIPTATVIHGIKKLDTASIRKYLSTVKADGLFEVRVLPYNKKKEKIGLPLVISDDARDPRHKSESSRRTKSDNFYSDLYPSYQVTGKADTWEKAEVVRVEFILVRISDAQHYWSAYSKFIKAKKLNDSLDELIVEVLDALNNQNLIESR